MGPDRNEAPFRPVTSYTRETAGRLLGLFLVTTGSIAYVIAPASFLPLFVSGYAIGKAAGSASISAVFLAWALFQIPRDYVMDRYDNRRLVVLGTTSFLLAAVLGLVTIVLVPVVA